MNDRESELERLLVDALGIIDELSHRVPLHLLDDYASTFVVDASTVLASYRDLANDS